MVMEVATGVPLKDMWSQMTSLQHIECIGSIGRIAKEMGRLDFANFGSLYFGSPDKPTGAFSLDEKYCIGPHCARQHWGYKEEKGARLTMSEGPQGPCESSRIHAATCLHTEFLKGMT